MPTNRLIRSTPFWVLVGGSVVTIAGGAYLLISKLTLMASTLTDGTATGVEVYAGQIWAVLGAILIGAGVIGLALALTLGALRAVVSPAATIVEAPVWAEEVVEVVDTPAYTPAAAPAPEVVDAPETRASARAAATESAEPTVAFEAAVDPAAEPTSPEAPTQR
ncbi:dinucleotide-utilizing enzyme [Microbacterium dextranolyticum]|uniref:Dinucleotide-utilizing enzyme n=1 Tax=Microbacterium dextranolyticum TaxID=36806 RepID=A0A9W6HMY6_9MICO|nr:dinucleotide-utilizing enzyme [Microbacterium dextranolyticum]MBM7462709.1 hypothetical protein [Microbacterium dextranolyticum]GLJ96186.1 hypothetical protein GCM10017591_22490 [Microbacterium dextranolyticum]